MVVPSIHLHASKAMSAERDEQQRALLERKGNARRALQLELDVAGLVDEEAAQRQDEVESVRAEAPDPAGRRRSG